MAPSHESSRGPGNGRFATTHWSVVQAAGREGTTEAREALATLCEAYWYPLYAFVRRQGHQHAEAQDLTQGFFVRLLDKQDWRDIDPQRGRFRSFLLASMKHFLLNEYDRQQALKRGGDRVHWSWDFEVAESRFRREPAWENTPEDCFDRQWALQLLERAQERLRRESEARGDGDRFAILQPFLAGPGSRTYREVAAQLELTESAVKVAVHRLRGRFRDCLREEIAQTLVSPDDIDGEIRDLFQILRK